MVDTPLLSKIDLRHLNPLRDLAARSFTRLWAPQDFAYFLAHDFRIALGIFTPGKKAEPVLRSYFLGLVIQGDLDVISIATAPECRRRGYGERLMNEACRDTRVQRAFLEVAVNNAAAIAMYQKQGFTIGYRRKGYYDGIHDAFVMRWEKKR